MIHPPFNIPALETMNGLLPAFDFTAILATHEISAIYLAKQRSLDRNVAIKILAPHISTESEFRKSFETTARSMAKLNHPNLIGVFDSGYVKGMLYFVMEFVPGKSLERSAQGRRIELTQAISLIHGICEGLSHAHDHKIIHGNLSMLDILLNHKAQPKIGNFGIARLTEPSANAPSNLSLIAPEVLSNPHQADQKSDIFSVGAMLYQLATGHPHGPDAPLPSSLIKCTAEFDALWQQATHADPNQRFPDMRSLLKALAALTAKPKNPLSPVTRIQSPTDAPSSPPPTQELHKVGPNLKLFRNLLIIAGLMYAIYVVWNYSKNIHAQRDQQAREALAKQEAEKQQALAEARNRKLSTSHPTNPPATPDHPPDPIPKIETETPAASLARLKSSLAGGIRTEMPVGCIRQGESDFLLVSTPMSWPDATGFAEQHGAHLAIPNADANLSWMAKNISPSQPFWIGAARSGSRNWVLADGSPWQPGKEPPGPGPYVAADRHGFLHAESINTLHPFIIQWHRDGKNPGTLNALLANTRESIIKANPVFPPGTRAIHNRLYLFVPRAMTWRAAVDLAATSGGHLAVASDATEISSLQEMADNTPARNGIWLGGFLKGSQWVWITGEPWKSAKWVSDSSSESPDTALILLPNKGWDARNLSEPSSGFIIEWSNDRKSKPATPSAPSGTQNTSPTIDIQDITQKAKTLVTSANTERSTQLAGNIRDLNMSLDFFFRGLRSDEQKAWIGNVNRIKNSVVNNRMPIEFPRSSGMVLPAKLGKAVTGCARKQMKIDDNFLAQCEKIHSAYLTKLHEAFKQAQKSGQTSLAQSIQNSLDSSGNLHPWIQSFGIDPKPGIPALSDATHPPHRTRQSPNDDKLIVE